MAGADRPAAVPAALLIFPCNGNAVEALDCLGSDHLLLGFVDDTPAKQGRRLHGHAVHSREALREWPDAKVLAVPGSPTSYRTRRRLVESLRVDDSRWARVIHPTARVSPLATIGHDVLLMAGVVVTSNAVIGNPLPMFPELTAGQVEEVAQAVRRLAASHEPVEDLAGAK